jgi:hypothetical protein
MAPVALRQAVGVNASTNKEAVGEVLPAGEARGVLNEQRRPREGLAAFEARLAVTTNRFNGLSGVAHLAEIAGESAAAIRPYRELLAASALVAHVKPARGGTQKAFLARQLRELIRSEPSPIETRTAHPSELTPFRRRRRLGLIGESEF